MLAMYGIVRLHSSWDKMVLAPVTHMYIVSVTAAITLLVSIFIGVAAYRLRNIQLLCLSLGFISMTELFTAHGISTPSMHLMQQNASVFFTSVTAELSLTFLGLWLWISSFPSDSKTMIFLARQRQMLIPVVILGLVIIDGLLLSLSSIISMGMENMLIGTQARYIVAMVCLVFYVLAGSRYYISFRFSRLPLQRAIVSSTSLMCVVQVIMSTSTTWSISWWSYYAILFASILIIIAGIIRQYASDTSLGTAIRGVFSADPVERIEAGIGPKVRTLVLATERRDKYTAGHNFRVATYAVMLGQAMGIGPEGLRALAQGGSVHDVGKIQIPDEILNKPGKLTDEERRIIEQHPVRGYEVCKRLGFMKDELDVVRHHHERVDGRGYPDKLKGDDIPLLARITAVADVYDALTSSRSYRAAMSYEDALRILEEGAGTQFDPACVAAWKTIDQAKLEITSHPTWLQTETNTSNPGLLHA